MPRLSRKFLRHAAAGAQRQSAEGSDSSCDRRRPSVERTSARGKQSHNMMYLWSCRECTRYFRHKVETALYMCAARRTDPSATSSGRTAAGLFQSSNHMRLPCDDEQNAVESNGQ
eukprot:6213297-Pleurochrysis_carterae.AAC.1